MIVVVRIDVSDDARRDMRRSMGRTGLATRDEIRSLVELAMDQALVAAAEDAGPSATPRTGRAT